MVLLVSEQYYNVIVSVRVSTIIENFFSNNNTENFLVMINNTKTKLIINTSRDFY
jgi:hypothetical protein